MLMELQILGTAGLMILGAVILFTVIICVATILFVNCSIIYSRIAFSLLVAIVVNQSHTITDSTFISYLIWAAIVFGIIMALSILPRPSEAIRFFCTIIISILVIDFVILMFGGIISSMMGKDFQITKLFEIVIKVVCTLMSLGAMITQMEKNYCNIFTNPILIHIERLLASLIYGVAITFLCMSMNQNWELSNAGYIISLAGGTVVTFLADLLLRGKINIADA